MHIAPMIVLSRNRVYTLHKIKEATHKRTKQVKNSRKNLEATEHWRGGKKARQRLFGGLERDGMETEYEQTNPRNLKHTNIAPLVSALIAI